MQDHINTGKKGEDAAVKFLLQQGYGILHRNWRYRRLEVDIIAEDKNYIVFVEVKTLKKSIVGDPETKVDRHKEKMIANAAEAWLRSNENDKELRFDVIAVVIDLQNQITIRHFPDAFYPIGGGYTS